MCFFIDLPVMHKLLATRQRVVGVKNTQLVAFFIRFQLIFDILYYCLCILPYRIDIVALAPKFAISVCKLHISPFLKYYRRAFSFQISHNPETLILGGIVKSMCIWSEQISASNTSTPFH